MRFPSGTVVSILVFIFFTAIFYFPLIFQNEVFYCCDNLLINIPAKFLLVDSLKSGVFPFWNPFILSGMPYLADINLFALNPLNILYFLFNPFRALSLSIIIYTLFSLSGMYLLARSFKLDILYARVAAIIYSFSGAMVVYANNVSMFQVAALTPLCIWAWVNVTINKSSYSTVLLIFLLSLRILSGHPQLNFYSSVVEVILFLYLSKKKNIFLILYIFIIYLLVISITSIQLLPFVEFALLSTRTRESLDYSTFGSFNPIWLIRLLIPNIIGVYTRGTAWAQSGSIFGFAGVISLLLSSYVSIKLGIQRFFVILLLLCLLLAFGKYTPIFKIFYLIVPGIGSFRVPSNFLLLCTLAISLLSAFGLREVLRQRIEHLKRFTSSSILFIVLCLLMMFIELNSRSIFSLLWALNISSFNSKLQYLGEGGFILLSREIFIDCFITAILLLILGYFNKKQIRGYILFFVFVELLIVSRNNLDTMSFTTIQNWIKETDTFINSKLSDNHTSRSLYTTKSAYFAPRQKTFGKYNEYEESFWQLRILRPNIPMLYNIFLIDGYSSLIYKSYHDYFIPKKSDPTGIASINDKYLDSLGVKYVVSSTNEISNADFRQFYDNGNFSVYKSQTTGSKLRVLNGKQSIAHVAEGKRTVNELELLVDVDEPSIVMYLDVNYPGWSVFVNGQRGAILQYDSVFKSVKVPSGKSTITFSYKPTLLNISILLGLNGLIIIALLIRKRELIDRLLYAKL